MFKHTFQSARVALKGVVERNVHLQRFAFDVLYYCSFLLPHDSEYYGVTQLPLNPDDSIVDVGANMGLSALGFRKLMPKVKILSLEPNPIHMQALERIRRSDTNFDFRMVGVGDQATRVMLYVPYYKSHPLHTFASLDRAALELTCQSFYGPRFKHIRIEAVPVAIVTIDELNVCPAFIKIDAEGSELGIIKGALKTIQESRPYLLIENNPSSFPAVKRLLENMGYRAVFWDCTRETFTSRALNTRNIFLFPHERKSNSVVRAA
ncbi:hypothetical protein AYO40_01975 [Planctomycetaceae bacterium SCGC AG-212-D15]|nr:hypothetical protein AYO40_01975 [Planctomycetaceae bacterium SCGC AG-212-D15]